MQSFGKGLLEFIFVDLFTIKILMRFLEFKDQENSSDNKVLSMGRMSMFSSKSHYIGIWFMMGNSQGASSSL